VTLIDVLRTEFRPRSRRDMLSRRRAGSALFPVGNFL